MLWSEKKSRSGAWVGAACLVACALSGLAQCAPLGTGRMTDFARSQLKKEGIGEDDASLLLALDQKTTYVRVIAADVLSERGVRQAVPGLRRMLADRNEVHRLAAARSLLQLDDSSGIPAIKSLLSSRSSLMAISAAEVLAAHGDDSGLGVARSFLSSTQPAEHWAALKALGASSDPTVYCPALKAGLEDSNGFNRLAAVAMLQKKGTAQALDLVARTLSSSDESLRRQAALALNWSQNTDAILHMIDALTNDDPFVRTALAVGLARYAGRVIAPEVKRQVRSTEGARAVQADYRQWWELNKGTFDITKVAPLRLEEADGE